MTVVFPTAITPAYAYDHGYVQKDTLANGVGYWLKLRSAGIIDIVGIPTSAETIAVKNG